MDTVNVRLMFDVSHRPRGIWNSDAGRPCTASEIDDAISGLITMVDTAQPSSSPSFGRAELREDGTTRNWPDTRADTRARALRADEVARHVGQRAEG